MQCKSDHIHTILHFSTKVSIQSQLDSSRSLKTKTCFFPTTTTTQPRENSRKGHFSGQSGPASLPSIEIERAMVKKQSRAPDNCPSKPATCFSSFGDMVIFSQLDIHEPFSPASNFQSETSHRNRSFILQHLFCFVSI